MIGARLADEELGEEIDQPVLGDSCFGAFGGGARCDFEESDELFELVKDEQRISLHVRAADLSRSCSHDRTSARRVGGGEIRGQERRHAAFAHCDAVDHNLRAGLRLHADALGEKTIGDRVRDEARVQERGLARAGVAIKQDAAKHRDESEKPLRFRDSPEKDRLIDETKWRDAAKRLRRSFAFRNEDGRRLHRFRNARAHNGISLPFTCR